MDSQMRYSEYATVRIQEMLEDYIAGHNQEEVDMQDVLTDLLTDLRHWARLGRVNFELSLERSRMHHEEEAKDEEMEGEQ